MNSVLTPNLLCDMQTSFGTAGVARVLSYGHALVKC